MIHLVLSFLLLLLSSITAFAQRGVGEPANIYVDTTVAAKKQSELPITPSCLKVPGMDIDRNELKSCIAHFRTKGNGQCGTDAPLKLCELKRTVVVVTSRRAPDEVKVSCKEVVNAMQWVMDKCSDYGGWNTAGKAGELVVHVFQGPLLFRVPPSKQVFLADAEEG